MKVLQGASERGHEQIAYFYYPEVGLKAIVGIHSTVLGPSLGGCRMRLYQDEDQALEDVLRLSEGMTYKSSLAGLDLGGGKSCIIADPSLQKGRSELFEQFGKCVEHLHGRYIAAEDMGTSVSDVMSMLKHTQHVSGRDQENGGSGDPSPWTARGVFRAIEACTERLSGSKDLTKKTVTVQGVGHVGIYLVGHLVHAGAKVVVCDTNAANIKQCKEKYSVEVVEADAIYDVECDIYAPCAVGQTVNTDTLSRLKCDVIAGAANNQLVDEKVYEAITSKKIIYLPDFAINSGGVISCSAELHPEGYDSTWVEQKVDRIFNTTFQILDESQKRGAFTEVVAIELAKERISRAGQT